MLVAYITSIELNYFSLPLKQFYSLFICEYTSLGNNLDANVFYQATNTCSNTYLSNIRLHTHAVYGYDCSGPAAYYLHEFILKYYLLDLFYTLLCIY